MDDVEGPIKSSSSSSSSNGSASAVCVLGIEGLGTVDGSYLTLCKGRLSYEASKGCFSRTGDGDFATPITRERLRVVRVEIGGLPSAKDDVVAGGDKKEGCAFSNESSGISVSLNSVTEPQSELSRQNSFK